MAFSGSTEESKYVNALAKEKKAFEKLVSVVISSSNFGVFNSFVYSDKHESKYGDFFTRFHRQQGGK
jgi:hypothetical protein